MNPYNSVFSQCCTELSTKPSQWVVPSDGTGLPLNGRITAAMQPNDKVQHSACWITRKLSVDMAYILFFVILCSKVLGDECSDYGGMSYETGCFQKQGGTAESRDSCVSLCSGWHDEGKLASFTSKEEFDFLVSNFVTTVDLWIGLFVNTDDVNCPELCPVCTPGPAVMNWHDERDATYVIEWENNFSLYPFSWNCDGGKYYTTIEESGDELKTRDASNTRGCLCRFEVISPNNYTCFGIRSNESNVCSGNGNCIGNDDCDCSGTYVGDECETWTPNFGCSGATESFDESTGRCFSYFTSQYEFDAADAYCDTNTQNLYGSLASIHTDEEMDDIWTLASGSNFFIGLSRSSGTTCPPSNPLYSWTDNSPTTWVYNSPPVSWSFCGSGDSHCARAKDGKFEMRKCVDTERFMCRSYIPICDGLRAHTASNRFEACNQHGYCQADESCSCYLGYDYSQYCDIWVCNDVLSNDTNNECSGHGICVELETCECQADYYGDDCEVTTCYGIWSNATEGDVCGGNGDCFVKDECDCHDGYYGMECNITTCYDVYSNDTDRSYCNKHGSCDAFNHCNCEDGYFGEQCTIVECFDDLSNSSTFCSGHGSCTVHDECRCSEDYYGEVCNLTKCHENWNNETGYCNGHGKCEFHDKCVCDEGYYSTECTVVDCHGDLTNGTEYCSGRGSCLVHDECQCPVNYYGMRCEVTTCGGNYNNETGAYCNGHGGCDEYNHCDCETGYYGVNCDVVDCHGKLSNQTGEFCSNRGNCDVYNHCECHTNYFGEECEVTTCFSKWSNESGTFCNDQGTCEVYNQCQCNEGYFGLGCTTVDCFGELSNTTNYCSGHGSCTIHDRCDCEEDYYGEVCETTMCHGSWNNVSGSYCDNHGSCIFHNHCNCEEGYYGEQCTIVDCHGTLTNQTGYCGGHGDCYQYDRCECNENYYGLVCDITTCNDKWSNSTFYCSNRGSCEVYGNCDCSTNYFGEECEVTKCGSYFSNETSEVCNGDEYMDSCWPHNHCNCKTNYYGENCEVTKCDNKFSNDTSNVCGGPLTSNECWPFDTCDCKENYYGEICDVTTCFDIYSNESSNPNLCSDRGTCWPYQICQCDPGYYGTDCNITTCNGVFSNDTMNVCSNRGTCMYLSQTCDCFDDYFGPDCGDTKCHGKWNNETDKVCSGHGICELMTRACNCSENYNGSECEIFSCFEYPHDAIGEVCTDHGDCLAHDDCGCEPDYNISSDCSIWECYGFLNNETDDVCSGHGLCSKHDECGCYVAYPGYECQLWSCAALAPDDPETCGGNGVCRDWDSCSCFPGYRTTDEFCDMWDCAGISKDHEKVCSERGECVSPDRCICKDSYEGDDCETWSCGWPYDSPLTCSGNGVCVNPGECQCSDGYAGELCDYHKSLAVGLAVSLPIVGVGLALTVGTIILFLLCVFCCAVCGFCIVICALCASSSVFLGAQKKKLKRFSKLRNFDMLLKEQEIEEEEDFSTAKLKINKSLFEIEYDEIEMVRILGEGGSDSTVYEALWTNQRVAFKCFKTRDLCSSQKSFDEFEREVSVMSSISHPNVIRFFGCTLKPPRIGIIMEFCENGDLKDFLFLKYPKEHNDEDFPWEGKMRILKEVAMSLEYLHSRNIIHRDLKLENVLLDHSLTCKLMDFGLSKLVDRMSQAKTQRIGTSVYIAPEVILHSKYDQRCDVYSYGIMAFMIVSGNLYPFGPDENCIELKVAQDPNYRPQIHELDKFLDSYPETRWLKRIIQVCWSHDPSKRMSFKEIGEFLIKFQSDIVNQIDENLMDEQTMEDKYKDELKQEFKIGSKSDKKDLMDYIQMLMVENQKIKNDYEEMKNRNESQTEEIRKLKIELEEMKNI